MKKSSDKVKESIMGFIEKLKAMDAAIPEEIAEDALTMAEEVNDAIAEDEVVNPVEVTTDEKSIESRVEDAVIRALRAAGVTHDASVIALDKLEEELNASDELSEEENKAKDAQIRFIRQMKPVIANMTDERAKKKITDSMLSAMKVKVSSTGNAQYSSVLSATRSNVSDSAGKAKDTLSDEALGMDIAKRFNPHYKKEAN